MVRALLYGKGADLMTCAKHALILINLGVLFLPAFALGQVQIQIHTGTDLQALEKSEQEVVSYHFVLSDEQGEANPPYKAIGMGGGEVHPRTFYPHTTLPHMRNSSTRASESLTNTGGFVGDRLRGLQQMLGDAQKSLTVLEGNSKTFKINLDSQPSGEVTGTITGHGNTNLEVSPVQLTFTPANWNVKRTVTVTAKQDNNDTVENVKLMLTFSEKFYKFNKRRYTCTCNDHGR